MKKILLAFVALAMSFGVANAGDHKANIIVVTHGSDTDAFWGVVRNAVEAAKEDTGANVQYRNPPTGDLNEMASLIEAAIAQNPDGIVVSIPDANILPQTHSLNREAFLQVIFFEKRSISAT